MKSGMGIVAALCFASAAWGQQGAAGRRATPAPAAAAKPAEAAAPAPAPPALAPRGPTRIDFDDRLLQGQTNKLGAVYLYQRKAPAQQSLLQRRQGFRDEIARDLLE